MTPLRIFISYAHDKYAGLAARLAADLQKHGFDVWFDPRLRTGDDWGQEIQDRLQWAAEDPQSGRFIYLLTVQSTRKGSFCLRELPMAQDLKLPVFPLMVETCTRPVLIYHLQYHDMRDCWPLEDHEPVYQQHLKTLLADLEGRPPKDVPLTTPLAPKATEGNIHVHQNGDGAIAIGPGAKAVFNPDFYFLPKADDGLMGFIKIPGGPFLMGSDPQIDKQASDDEFPQHTLDLPDFYIQRFPVTAAQFAAFVKAAAYQPRDPDSLNGIPNHPVVWVAWYDALAYCKWLNEILLQRGPQELRRLLAAGWRVTLPSEAQWEKAARGEDGRIYPWGNEFNSENANTDKSGIGSTSPVGSFPGGVSPYGLSDMGGNVWEWTCSLWGRGFEKYPYSEHMQERENLQVGSEISRVLRGGSWANGSRFARCAFRLGNLPEGRLGLFGFRVVVSPPS